MSLIGTQGSEQSVDALIHRLARCRHGVVTRAELLRSGVTSKQIALRVRDGRLTALHRGVYLVGAVASEHAYSQAALLACGADAVLSHRSAIALWGLGRYASMAYPWVTIPPDRRIVRPRVVLRRALLEPRDVRSVKGMRVVSPPRAVLDMASLMDDAYDLEALVAEAAYRRRAFEPELRDQIDRNGSRPGAPLLRLVLDIEGGPQRTRSKAERWFLGLLRKNGFEGFEMNATVCGREVDVLWRESSFCVELDGWDGHSSRVAFERDRRKWALLQANGVDVMPIAPRAAMRDEAGTIDRLRRTLALRAK